MIAPLRKPGDLVQFGAAPLFTGLALGLSLALATPHDHTTLLFFVVGVILTAWVAGLGPALLAIALSLVAILYRLMPPIGSPTVRDVRDLYRLGVFLFVSGFVTWVIDRFQRSEERLRQANQALLLQKAQLASAIEGLEAQERELIEADRAKDQFLAMLGHELRNPLGVILNALFMLRSHAVREPSIREEVTAIDRQARHLVRLVGDLLDVSRIRRGKIDLERRTMDLVPLIREGVADLRSMIEAAGLTLILDLPESPLWINGDAVRLTQVVSNLLHNAMKFTEPEGQVWVRATTESGFVLLSVRDTGVGIAADLLPRVFEPFTQADAGLDRSQGGLGLGLAMVKGLVTLHGGQVAVASDGPGHGAEITIRIPLIPAPAPSRASSVDPSVNGEPRGR